MRDAMDAAAAQLTFKEKPLRVGLDMSQERKDKLNTFFRAQDSLQQHWNDLGLEAKLTPCVATLRLHGMGPRCMCWAASRGQASGRVRCRKARAHLLWGPLRVRRATDTFEPRQRGGI